MEKVILFGASNLGKIAYDLLKSKFDILYFCDNNKEKWGNKFCNKLILSPEELKNIKNHMVIITSSYYEEISVQLSNLGIHRVKAFKCGRISGDTYNGDYFLNDIFDYSEYKNFQIDPKFKSQYIDNFSLLYDDKGIQNNIIYRGERKKVLIIAYSFPPIAGSGVQRTLKFVKYLRQFGWEPIVIGAGKTYGLMYRDKSLLNDIESNLNVIRIDHEYYNVENIDYKFLQQLIYLYYGMIDDDNLINQYINEINSNKNRLKNLAFIPDSFICWANVVLNKIEHLIDLCDIDLIFSTASPEVDHIIAYYLKRKYKKPWVAEFRDEWTNNPYYLKKKDTSSIKYRIERELENTIVHNADKVISVTPLSTENYINNFGIPRKKIVTLTNGYDEQDFKDISDCSIKDKKHKFLIIANGSLYSVRTPYSFILAVNTLIVNNLINKDNIEIRLTDDIESNIKKNIYNIDIYNIVNIIPYMEHIDSLKEAAKANVLLLIVGKDEEVKSIYTGKVFEYLRLMKPILAISPKASVVEKLLKDTGCGKNYHYNDIEGMANYILTLYNQWSCNCINFKPNKNEILKYDRKRLTEKLAQIFEELLLEERD